MNKLFSLSILVFFLSVGHLSYGQENCADGIDNDADGLVDLNDPDCDCPGIGGSTSSAPSMIPNPSFEDNSCCPSGPSQLTCADNWIQASAATSDYWNFCDFSSYPGFNPVGTPLPGDGTGSGWGGFISQPGYSEYLGACLSGPMLAGTPYVLNMWIALADGEPTLNLTLYGTDDCADLPWAGFACPIGVGGWQVLDDLVYTMTSDGSWTEITLTFTPTVDILAIAIGGPCVESPIPGGSSYNYYWLDELTIDSVAFAGGNIVETGNWCDADLTLTSTIDSVGWTVQWYQDGVALPGETTEVLNIMPYGAGVFSVVYTIGTECDESAWTVTIPDAPIADFTWIDQCQDFSTINFTDASTIASGTITGWNWDFGDGNTSTATSPSNTYAGPGTYTVTLTVSTAGGCTNTISYPVTIFPEPIAGFDFAINGVSSTTGITGGCFGYPVVFTNNSTVGVPDNITITNWDFGDGSTSGVSDPTYTYAADGTFIVELAVETNNGCQDTIQIPIDIYPIPVAGFTVNPVCENLNAVFTDGSTITSGSVTGWEWNFDDGSPFDLTGGPINHSYGAGTYNPTLVVTSDQGCSDTITLPLTIYAVPVAEFTTSDVCNGESSTFTDASTISSGTITGWSYDFGDGSPLDPTASPTYTYASTGTYNVTLTVTSDNGCTDDTTIVHNVSSAPTANFTTNDVCQDVFATFTDASTVGTGVITSWEWDFGDGSPFDLTSDPDHNYTLPGTYNVTLIVQAGSVFCADTITIPITIHPMPVADFTTGPVCQDVTAMFTDNSTVTTGLITGWEWDLGDGSPFDLTGGPVNHNYASNGTFDVTLTITTDQGCEDDITLPIDIYAVPVADFTSSTICENEGPTSFTDNSTIAAGSYTLDWDFGDGNTGTGINPTNTYAGDGTYNTTLTITSDNGCTSTITFAVNVLEQPTAAFTSDPPIVCNPGCVKFYDGSSGVSPITNWDWDFSNGGITTGQNPTPCFQHQSDFTEYYDVTLTVTNAVGCSNSATAIDYVAVEQTPTAQFVYQPYVLTIEDTRVFFTNKSTAASTYLWDFGDWSPNSTDTNPEHNFPEIAGEYLVRLDAYSASGQCTDYTVQLITIDDIIIFYVPNVFTPDGDTYNEMFQPVFFSGFDPFDFNLTIFNRWGEVVFESFDASRGWDGTYGSRGLVEDGTYVWQIEFKETMSEKKHRHRGHVTILK